MENENGNIQHKSKEAGSKKARSQKSRSKTGWKRYSGRVVLSRKGGLFIYPPFFLFPSKIVAAARISASGVWTFPQVRKIVASPRKMKNPPLSGMAAIITHV